MSLFFSSPRPPTHTGTTGRQTPSAAPLWVQVNLSVSGKRMYNRSRERASKLKGKTSTLRLSAPDHNALSDSLEREFSGFDCDFHPEAEAGRLVGAVGLSKETLVNSFKEWATLGPRLISLGFEVDIDDRNRGTLIVYAKLDYKNGRGCDESTSSVEKGQVRSGDVSGGEGVFSVDSLASREKTRVREAFDNVKGLWPRPSGVPNSWNTVPKWVRDMILVAYKHQFLLLEVKDTNAETDLSK